MANADTTGRLDRQRHQPRTCNLRSRRTLLTGLMLGVVLTTCAVTPWVTAATPAQANQDPADGGIPIQVTSNGWHSAIVVPRAAVPTAAIPETADFPTAVYLSFSWGDAEYFPEPDPSFATTLRAGLRPTPAVMHLVGLESPVGVTFPSVEIVDLTVTADGLQALLAYLDGSFARREDDGVASSEPGLYRFSRFYPATGEFHIFNTCNTWTARGLAAAGLAIQPRGVMTADELMNKVRPLAQARATN